MEIEDLKQAWSQYDNNLKKNLKINQEILRNMKIDKSKRELRKPMVLEIISATLVLLVLPLIFAITIKYLSESKYSVPGMFGFSLMVFYLVSALMKVNRFVKMDYYKSSIVTLQKNLNKLKTCILRLRRIELYLIPLLVLSLLPIAFKAIHNIDIYTNVKLFIFEIVFILGICYPLTIWINKHLYDNKLRDVKSFLDEIADFEKEE